MAKQKRWAVRADERSNIATCYAFFVGRKPRKPSGGWHSDQPGYVGFEGPYIFEKVFPKCYHLPAGGGPVLIRFADEV